MNNYIKRINTLGMTLILLIVLSPLSFAENTYDEYSWANYHNEYSWGDYTRLNIVDLKISERFCEKNWIPVRKLFAPFVNNVDWDNKRKIAIVRNDGKELIFSFSKKEIKLKKNQFLIPESNTKFIKGRVYIDGVWIAWLFDRNLTKGTDKVRDSEQQKYSFLGIKETDILVSAKDSTIYLHVMLKKKK